MIWKLVAGRKPEETACYDACFRQCSAAGLYPFLWHKYPSVEGEKEEAEKRPWKWSLHSSQKTERRQAAPSDIGNTERLYACVYMYVHINICVCVSHSFGPGACRESYACDRGVGGWWRCSGCCASWAMAGNAARSLKQQFHFSREK